MASTRGRGPPLSRCPSSPGFLSKSAPRVLVSFSRIFDGCQRRMVSASPAPSANYSEVKILVLGQFRSDEDKHVSGWMTTVSLGTLLLCWFPAHSLQKRWPFKWQERTGGEVSPAVGNEPEGGSGDYHGSHCASKSSCSTTCSAPGRLLRLLWDLRDPAGSAKLANRRKDFREPCGRSPDGSRNYGQRFLELAVTGMTGLEACSRLAQELKLIEWKLLRQH